MTDVAPDTGTTPAPEATTPEPTPEVAALMADLQKWKGLARKHEDQSKANHGAQKELDTLRQSTMTDMEKAVATAKAEARAETLREVGAERVADAVRVAAAGRSVDIDALLEGLDRARFLDAEGQPDVKVITAWVDRVAPKADEAQATTTFPDLGQGVRGSTTPLNGDPLLRDLKSTLGIR